MNQNSSFPEAHRRVAQGGFPRDDFTAAVTITYIYDPSSSSVNTKKDILTAVLAVINQKMSGQSPFIRSAERLSLNASVIKKTLVGFMENNIEEVKT